MDKYLLPYKLPVIIFLLVFAVVVINHSFWGGSGLYFEEQVKTNDVFNLEGNLVTVNWKQLEKMNLTTVNKFFF